MISSLRGTVLHLEADSLVLEVGGVGFSVAVPPDVARTAHLGDPLSLHTYLVVREDALSLYGFAERDELEVFSTLLGVSGVGPKSALGVLAGLTVAQIGQAVADEDDAPFRKVSGIGPKTAKLIVVQLQGKLAPPVRAAGTSAPLSSSVVAQVTAALTGLGWAERVATEAVTAVAAEATAEERGNVQALLRRTLAALGPKAGNARG